jgi:trk system potassium uptake protein TrkH
MRRALTSGQFTILLFFSGIILAGSLLLSVPDAWRGAHRLPYIDALFTAASAVCVTGLISVDTAQYSLFGKIVILTLIQIGGLGIMSLATLYLTNPGRRISFAHARLIRDFYVDDVEHESRKITRNILLFTLIAETAGVALLWARFASLERSGREFADGAAFTAVFHAVSAFCNAGFSLFSTNLEAYGTEVLVLGVIAALIVCGGLGFVVVQDLVTRLSGRSRSISLHSRIVVWMTAALIFGGAAAYYVLERRQALAGMSTPYALVNAVFQSITTRTAGFDVLPQSELSNPSLLLTLLLMFTGGAPGSTAGGVKVTTVFLVLLAVIRGTDSGGSLNVRNRRIDAETVARAPLFLLRALALLFAAILALCVSETVTAGADRPFLGVVFESFSAFGTVGLSMGLTSQLTAAGKLIVIVTMFAGRIGLITIAIGRPLPARQEPVEYPSEKVLIG